MKTKTNYSDKLEEILVQYENYVLLKEIDGDFGVLFDVKRQRHVCLDLELSDYIAFIKKVEINGIKILNDIDKIKNENYCAPLLVWNDKNERYDYVEREYLEEYFNKNPHTRRK